VGKQEKTKWYVLAIQIIVPGPATSVLPGVCKNCKRALSTVVYTCNVSTQEAEVGGSAG
jgi:hypothetical protein